MAKAKTFSWKAFWRLFAPFWTSEHRWPARFLLSAILAIDFLFVFWCLDGIATWQNKFGNMLQARDYRQFVPYLQELALLLACAVAFEGTKLFVQQRLRLRWRIWMTDRFLSSWMSGKAYYRLQAAGSDADNPDQRISEDAGFFAKTTLELMVGVAHSLAIIVWFSVRLWLISDPLPVSLGSLSFTVYGFYFWGCLAFYGAGTWLAHLVGRRLVPVKYEQKQREADFRFSMMRTRENSESIAFYGGEKMELEGSRARFAGVVENFARLIVRKTWLQYYTSGFRQGAELLPFLMIAPYVLGGSLAWGTFLLLQHVYKQVKEAFSYLVSSYESLAELAAIVRRLDSLEQSMAEAAALPGGARLADGTPGVYETRELCVQLPGGRRVLQNLSLALRRGVRMLVTGPSGCGKSTFLRTVSGIWPFGSGEVRKAPEERTLFLPQRPYLPLGTLRRAVCYPMDPLPASEDARLHDVLRKVDLARLIPLLDREDDWSRILSLGEQQRIAFARVLLVRPAWVFLDESTSALDERRERDMYTLIARELPGAGIVSVGHRTTLLSLHDRQLQLDGSSWSLSRLSPAPDAPPA